MFDPTAQADFGDGIIGHARHYGNHVLRIRRSAAGECANVDLSTQRYRPPLTIKGFRRDPAVPAA
ncbi:hypothetical protein ABZ589_38825, partial [Streptomyces sp. NPDC013313]|uniref:hypothetical protein n=1 Tax=Streptomyces sp. NPDC013313 TaxID=3155603 RepID=UPI003401D6B1